VTEIETARLLLRPWQPDDLAEFTRLLTDPLVTCYIVVHTPFSPEDVAELSARTLDNGSATASAHGRRSRRQPAAGSAASA
jgi:RimJ/RimL family protein N-acetyltransferase